MSNQPKIQFETQGKVDKITLPVEFTDALSHHWEMLAAIIPIVVQTMIGDGSLPTQNAGHILSAAFENFRDDFQKIGEPNP